MFVSFVGLLCDSLATYQHGMWKLEQSFVTADAETTDNGKKSSKSTEEISEDTVRGILESPIPMKQHLDQSSLESGKKSDVSDDKNGDQYTSSKRQTSGIIHISIITRKK